MSTKPTLLEIVQIVLNDMSGDPVNSISDTDEAEEVAQHVRSVYRNLVSRSEWPHTRRAVQLIPFSDNNFPTHMRVGEEYRKLISVNYNKAKNGETRLMYQPVHYLEPDRFLRKLNARDNNSQYTDIIVDPSGINLMVGNNRAPEYFTSFDDVVLVFDSYDSAVDSTLQSSKAQAMAYILPEFRLEDSFVPDLPSEAFSYLIEEVISRAQLKMRQFQDVKSEVEAQKQSRWLSQSNFVVKGGVTFPDYGRRGKYGIRRL